MYLITFDVMLDSEKALSYRKSQILHRKFSIYREFSFQFDADQFIGRKGPRTEILLLCSFLKDLEY